MNTLKPQRVLCSDWTNEWTFFSSLRAACLVSLFCICAAATPAWAQDTTPKPVVNPNPNPPVDVIKAISKEKEKVPKKEVNLLPELTFSANGEYRMRSTRIDPLELNGEDVRKIVWHEHRLRLNTTLEREKLLKLYVQMDVLDGVLFGDNGQFGKAIPSNSGVSLATKRPNNTTIGVGLPEGGDRLDREAYRPTLTQADPLQFNFVYADVILPVGLLRVGRQPQAYGANLASHDGDRLNRWGVSVHSDTADRILFGTKLDEAVKVAMYGKSHKPDLALDKGVFLGISYDFMSQGNAVGLPGDLRQTAVALQWRHPNSDLLGLDWRDIFVSAIAVKLGDDDFDTDIWGFPMRAEFKVNDFSFEGQMMIIRGQSREVSEGFAALSNKEPSVQDLRAYGALVRGDYKLGPVTMTMEFDYASGDADPRPNTPITSYSFARDMNVGLLLFERVLAYETARSVAVGIENLSSLDAPSFPLTEVQTDGRFTNAVAIFPQLKIDVVDSFKHKFHTRLGVLMAWPEADGVVDPVLTILGEDGDEIADDAVNFHGGKPGSYYGTEFDVQLQWTWKDTFVWTLEGALLQPGSALQDEHGDAVMSYMLENRFEYLF